MGREYWKSSFARDMAKKSAGLESLLRRVKLTLQTALKSGGVHPRDCSICGYRGYFGAAGSPPRWDARCPKCSSFERHRLLALVASRNAHLISGQVVHFAPEPAVARFARPLAASYMSADLQRTDCDIQLNIEAIALADQSVDTFIASHVLEHVDDAKALRELYRCLKPGGRAIIMVPIVEGWRSTYENPEIQDEYGRDFHFGQFDHVRYYGADVRQRIRDAGFDLVEHVANPADSLRFGLMRGDAVFIATRPA